MIIAYFREVSQASPVQKDFDRVVNHDDKGNEFITYAEVDYPAIQASHGLVDVWKLESLLKAGINPNFAIHTGLPTRLEGAGFVGDAAAYAEQILAEDNKSE